MTAASLALHGMEGAPLAPDRRKAWLLALGPLLITLFAGSVLLWGGSLEQVQLLQYSFGDDGQLVPNIYQSYIMRTWLFAGQIAAWYAVVGLAGGGLLAVVAALVRSSAMLRVFRGLCWTNYLLCAFVVVYLYSNLSAFKSEGYAEALGGALWDNAILLKECWSLIWPFLVVACYTLFLHVASYCRAISTLYDGLGETASAAPTAEDPYAHLEPGFGDYVLEDVRVHGKDRRLRLSLYGATFLHLFYLVIIPALAMIAGCLEPYRVPKGSGNPVAAMVQMVKPKKKKKKKLVLRPDSAIYFDVPDFDESQVDEVVDQMSQAQYQAHSGKAGKMGKGGGSKGGWPNGMENGKIRFIRVKYRCRGWNDGMDHTRADQNFLAWYKAKTGFKAATKGEEVAMSWVNRYPKDGFPPFLYMTGLGGFRVSNGERQAMRDYVLGGGMIWADAGDAAWGRSFRNFVNQILPGKRLVDIDDGDVIFQQPFPFPEGAPPFAGHAGNRALGVKHEGRWVVFYHPGDMNDAWKSDQYSAYGGDLREKSFQLGCNILYYSFNQWDAAVAKYRK